MKYERKLDLIYQHLDLPYKIDITKVINYIIEPRFKATESKDKERLFSYTRDYDLIYALMLKDYRIDLENEKLDWWKFTACFNELLASENALTKRIGFRAYKVPSKRMAGDEEEVKFNLNKKLQYQLEKSQEDVDNEAGKMFKMLERRSNK